MPVDDPRWNQVRQLDQVPDHLLNEIEQFFLTYKILEAKKTRSQGWVGRDETVKYIGERCLPEEQA